MVSDGGTGGSLFFLAVFNPLRCGAAVILFQLKPREKSVLTETPFTLSWLKLAD